MTTFEAIEKYKVSRSYLKYRIKNNLIKATKKNGKWDIDEESLSEYFKKEKKITKHELHKVTATQYLTAKKLELKSLTPGTKVKIKISLTSITNGFNKVYKAEVMKRYPNYIRFKIYAPFGSWNECYLRSDLANKIDWSVI